MTGRIKDGSPEPLGVTLDAHGVNVAIFSANATAIELCLFDEAGSTEIERLRLPCRTGDVHHGHFEGIRAGQRYGLRAYGPYAPKDGHRFNPSKLLIDPHARALDRPLTLVPEMFGYQFGSSNGDLSFDPTDSAPFMPKGIILPANTASPLPYRRKPWSDTYIYELHVRGLTKTHPGVDEAIRGTFAGLKAPAVIEHLLKLGVTAIEVMPCAAWVDERHLQPLGLTNYWGYNPVAFMVPDPRLAPGGWEEIRSTVDALHEAGIEVIVDVVFNHTGEGDALGPTLSLRGLDNASYYRLTPGALRHSVNDTGCGNTLALDRPPVVRLVMDALRTWVELGGVDGFRFDLATTLARRDTGFDPAAPLITAITHDPVLRDLRLIAEPWDIGPNGYQLGAFPAHWGEWNDQFRDTMRKFWRGNHGLLGATATRFAGSSDIFAPRRHPSRSINYIVAHDGFTLADLVSHTHKHNIANGESGHDGTNANYSWNNGVEGSTCDPIILMARRRDQRNLLATLILARGTPMLAMGAEFGHSQNGNNNAYAQDNPTSWLDWETANYALADFVARVHALRVAHPALQRDRFLSGAPTDASLIPDVEWLTPAGTPMQTSDWAHSGHTLIAALYAPAETDHDADRVIVVLHAGRRSVDITLPETRTGWAWHVSLDTTYETDALTDATLAGYTHLTVAAHTVVVLTEVPVDLDTVFDTPASQPAISQEALDRLTQAAGIAYDWHDVAGQHHIVPNATKQTLLATMGFPAASNGQLRESLGRLADTQDRRLLPTTLVAYEGEPVVLRIVSENGRAPTAVVIRHEDGSIQDIRLTPGNLEPTSFTALDGRPTNAVLANLPAQSLGRHRIMLEHAPDIACHLTVAPRRCFLPNDLVNGPRAIGIATQLYSLRRSVHPGMGNQGIGDFTTLAELAEIAARGGVATIGLNPLHALFPNDRERASPYYPSDRRFLDPIYIDIVALMAFSSHAGDVLSQYSDHVAALNANPQVDYPEVWALKRTILEKSFAHFEDLRTRMPDAAPICDFEGFVARGGANLQNFACFQAISDHRPGEAWTAWPDALRHAAPDALTQFAGENVALVRFHLYTQWLAERQFAEANARGKAAGLRLGFYRDLAVGAAPDGAEVWANANQFLEASVGAPPDPIAESGQNWGLRPPSPLAWQQSGYALFNDVLAANMQHAGALRIDHAMGLARLFVIPYGADASEGTYLSYPMKDLLAQVSLQSTRAHCIVIGEDLGTVPMGFRETMDATDILSYRVLWFERRGDGFIPAGDYPAKSVACVSTHDLPTLTGWLQGEDIAERQSLTLFTEDEASNAREQRLVLKRRFLDLLGLPEDAEPSAVIAAAHDFLRQTPSLIAMLQIDDLAGEVQAVNLPGTDRERPNWRRKLARSLGDWITTG